MSQAEYLKAEFLRYYPSSQITVHEETEDETIHVHIVTPINGEPNHFAQRSFVMSIGSDDDRYSFFNNHTGEVITVPLPGDEA